MNYILNSTIFLHTIQKKYIYIFVNYLFKYFDLIVFFNSYYRYILQKKPNFEGHPKEQYIQDFAKQWTAKKKPWLFAHVTCLKLNFTHLPSHDLWVQIRGWVCNILGPGNNGYISPNVSFHSHFAIFPPTWVGYSLLGIWPML